MRTLRKFANMRLTRRFHFRHMGLWLTIAIALVVLANVLIYVLLVQQWGFVEGPDYESAGVGGARLFARAVGTGLIVETVLLSFALVLLARTTSHRVAGPFIGLQRTCERIASGDREHRVHFRKYDGLEELETAFNTMVDSLAGKPSDPPRR